MDENDRNVVRLICIDTVEQCRKEEKQEMKEFQEKQDKILAWIVAEVIIVGVAIIGFLASKVIHLPSAVALVK